MLSIHEAPLGKSLVAVSLGATIGAAALHSYTEQNSPTIEARAGMVTDKAIGGAVLNKCAVKVGDCVPTAWQKSILQLDLTHLTSHASRSRSLYPTDEQLAELGQCEANGDLKYGGPGGHVDKGYEQFEGLYNFDNQTWRANKPAGYPAHAYQASKQQQDVVMRITWRRQGWAVAWPNCSKILGFR